METKGSLAYLKKSIYLSVPDPN